MNRLIAHLLTVLAVCFSAGQSPAAELPTNPQLRIDPGMHTAPILAVSADAAGRYLASAGLDKSIRIWSLKSGELLTTLRPPAGDGQDGELYAVAISPDAATVAAGGNTQSARPDEGRGVEGFVIYLFDRASGRLLRQLRGLPTTISELSFSPDSRYLAVGLSDSSGIGVFDAATGSVLDGAHVVDGVFGLGWHAGPTGLRLAGTSGDGRVHLWSVDTATGKLSKVADAAAPGDNALLGGIAFSPDGKWVAVGRRKRPAVWLLDASTLSPAKIQPRTIASEATDNDDGLHNVAWTDSASGSVLWAAGTLSRRIGDQWKMTLIRWPMSLAGTLGPPRETPVAGNSLSSLVSLPSGRVAFGTQEPSWGILNADGTGRRFVPSPVRDFRVGRLALFAGRHLRMGKLGFDLLDRRLDQPADAFVRAPRTNAPGLDLRNWANKARPTLNGQPLEIGEYETSRSLAISSDGQGFVLGTDRTLRRFNTSGREVWAWSAPGEVWAVNFSELTFGGQPVVLAAYGDGTIRAHRWKDGKELFALYAHPDNQRWILWTPSGYYDASPGGEGLIGFQVNRGNNNAADFFPAASFRANLYRPDVIDQLLANQDEAEAVRLADAVARRKSDTTVALSDLTNKLPPILTLLSPEQGSSVSAATVTVKLRVRSANDAPVIALRVRVNGQPIEIEGQRAVKPKSSTSDSVQTLVVPIPSADSEVTVFAESRHGTSTAASLKLVWEDKTPASVVPEFVAKPKLYVLAVGVSKYKQADLKLRFAAKDAQDFVSVVKKQKGSLYRDVVAKLLTDEMATRDEVLDGLEWIRREVTQRDVGMVFLAGHGFNDADGVFYYLPVEGDPDRIKRTGVVYNEIKNTLTNLAGKSIFFVDACHSGNVMGDGVRRRGQADMNFIVNELSSAENGVLVFASSTGRQFSLENTAWNNGAFTKALVEGLNGKADYNKNGRITHKMLDLYVSERVKELTKGQQTPKTLVPQGVTDYPIAVVK